MKQVKSCVYCGNKDNLTIDHVIPISRNYEVGIKRRILDNPSNKVLACRQCNEDKAAMLPWEWFIRHPDYKKRFLQEAKYVSNTIKQMVEKETALAFMAQKKGGRRMAKHLCFLTKGGKIC